MKKSEIIILIIIFLSFAIGIYFYPKMPEKMASHWSIKDEVNGYIAKFWGLFLMPLIALGLFLIFILIPNIDPLKSNIEKFRKYFDSFIVFIIFFLFYIYLLSILWNLGFRFSMGKAIMPVFGPLFYYCGILIENTKRNWFIGIRTPWTLSNDKVWDKTHKIGAKLFKIVGIIAFLGIIFPYFVSLLILIMVILAIIYTFIYSYFEYKKEMKF